MWDKTGTNTAEKEKPSSYTFSGLSGSKTLARTCAPQFLDEPVHIICNVRKPLFNDLVLHHDNHLQRSDLMLSHSIGLAHPPFDFISENRIPQFSGHRKSNPSLWRRQIKNHHAPASPFLTCLNNHLKITWLFNDFPLWQMMVFREIVFLKIGPGFEMYA